MSTQMYGDLIIQELTKNAKEKGESITFSSPVVGTLSGGSVRIDAFPEPVPYSDFSFLTDDKTTVKPTYTSGDRLFIIPANDGKQLVIVGRLI